MLKIDKVEVNNTTKEVVDVKLVKLVAEKFLKHYKKNKFEVSIAFVSDKEIQKLNKIYRGINKPTDVLSFEGDASAGSPQYRSGQAAQVFLGEIIISYSQIKKQAKEFGKTAKQELVFILVHGLLHLLGHTDETEKGRLGMIEEGERFIENYKLQITNVK